MVDSKYQAKRAVCHEWACESSGNSSGGVWVSEVSKGQWSMTRRFPGQYPFCSNNSNPGNLEDCAGPSLLAPFLIFE